MIGAMPAALTGGHGTLATCVTSSTGRLVCTSTTGLGAAFFVFLILEIAILVVSIVAAVQIVTKAGYSGWWVLTAIVPILNIVMFLVFAFSDWPVRRELAGLRSPWGSPGGGAYGSPPGSWGGPGPWGGGAAAPWSTSDPYAPTAAGPAGTYGARPETSGPTGSAPAGANPAPFVQGSSSPVEGDRSPSGEVDRSSSPGPGGEPSPTSSTPPVQPASAPAGWYPTPDGRRRYWDGAAWTDHFA